jgi:HEPN domain-containing protein
MSQTRDHSALLLRKAAQDEYTVDRLMADPASPDEVIGFHAQQSVEKLFKAVLAAAAVQYRYTHDLIELMGTLTANGIAVPPELDAVKDFVPFAVAFRYDDLPDEDDEPSDREQATRLLRRTREWAELEVQRQLSPQS